MSTWTLTHFTAHGPLAGKCGHRHSSYVSARRCATAGRKSHARTRRLLEETHAPVPVTLGDYDRVAVGVWTDERGYTRLDTDGAEGQEATG